MGHKLSWRVRVLPSSRVLPSFRLCTLILIRSGNRGRHFIIVQMIFPKYSHYSYITSHRAFSIHIWLLPSDFSVTPTFLLWNHERTLTSNYRNSRSKAIARQTGRRELAMNRLSWLSKFWKHQHYLHSWQSTSRLLKLLQSFIWSKITDCHLSCWQDTTFYLFYLSTAASNGFWILGAATGRDQELYASKTFSSGIGTRVERLGYWTLKRSTYLRFYL